MLENGKILEVISLLESRRFSMRTISRKTGISRGSIASIFRNMEKEKHRIAQRFEVVPTGPFRRCPECGAKTKLPCLGCAIKKWLGKHGNHNTPPKKQEESDYLAIKLNGNHMKRYLEIKQWRDKQANPNFTIIPDDWPWRRRIASTNSEQQTLET
ncbi:MAG: hypothetical protein ACRC10_02650 [Thermoguttaceae bacterium]